MTINELLVEITRRKIRIQRTGDDLNIRGTTETLEASFVSELKTHKSTLLRLTGNEDGRWCSPGSVMPEMLPLVQLTAEEVERIVSGVAGGVANVQDIYPLAPLQEGILFHHLMSGEGDPYLLASLLSFDSRARLEAYLGALQAVVDRHDILRTAVVWEGLSEPLQVVWRKAVLVVQEVELDPETGDASQQLYARFDPRRYRMDVRQAPLLRIYSAYDRVQERWLVMQTLHHLAGDHSTLEVVQEEIQAHLLGEANRLPTPLPFRNLVAQARLGVSRAEHERYFQRLLGDVEEPTAPFGLLDVRGDGTGIQEAWRSVDADLVRRMRERARKLGVSAASICHVAWAQTLACVSGREDVVFGTVLFGRMQGGVGSDRAIGLFVNTLPVRIKIDEGAEAVVRRTHGQLAELLRHEHASLALAQRCSGVPAPTPLFSALLNYRHSGSAAQARTERAWEGIRGLYGEERSNYPITLSVEDLGEELGLTAQVAASVEARRVCEYMHTALESLVEALENAPDRAVRTLQVLTERERQQVLYEWNDTQAEYPNDQCIHELFEQQVARTPGAVALVFEQESLSYDELNRRANRLAHYLRGLGVQPDARVAICVERGFEMVVGLLGVLKAGGAYVPLDPSYPEERLRYMLQDSGALALLTQQHLKGLFADIQEDLAVMELDEPARWQTQPETDPDRASVGLGAEHLAYVIYTSGSTGIPKGVAIEHGNAVNLICWAQASFPPEVLAQTLFSTSLNFDLAMFECYVPLTAGATVRMVRNALEAPHTDCTLINTVPSAMNALIETDQAPPTVRMVNLAGEPLKQALVERIFAATMAGTVCNLFGPSETTTYSAWVRMRREEGFVPHIGRPIANTRIYILDAQQQPVPVGVAGELYIGGAGVARGYLNRAELTAERFLKDPFLADREARMYRTGDLGRWLPDGNIEFLGRNDFQVKIRGFRIELGEIEARLAEHAQVREAVVVARQDTAGDKRLVAYYTCADPNDTALGAEVLRTHLAQKLPEYMVPAAYVRLESLPLTPNGKLDRRALPAPEADAFGVRAYEAPQTETEEVLAAIWAEVLKLDRVGRHDNFFELGGHSLLAVRVMTRVQEALSVAVPLSDLFTRPVLADLAHAVETAARAELPPIAVAERGERIPLSFAQQRLWFLAQMEGVSQAYHIPLGVRLHGELDRVALCQALDRIVARHEALRTTFAFVDGEPVQRIVPAEQSRFSLLEHDLRQHFDARGEFDRLIGQESRAAFDLESGPLIRGRLIREAEAEHTLLITMHHIVSDGWSMGVLLQELSALYGAFVGGGQADPLPELRVQYADYAVWQRKWMAGEILRRQAEYWKAALAGAPALLELPTDHARPAQQDYAGALAGLALDEELTAGLKALSKRQGTTLYMTLLAAWAALLARLSGQPEVVIGTPVANRNRIEIENLIGFFVNTLALRLDVSGTPTVSELLARVKQQALTAQQHQDIPFDQVVEITRPVRSLAHSPLFQVMFAWQTAPDGVLEFPGLEVRSLGSAPHVVAKFDLTLSLREAGERIVGGLEYATSLFEHSTIERYLGYFRRLLEGMVAGDSAAVDRLPMLPERERQQVLYEWNDTQAEYPNDQCIHELFEQQVARTPGAVALVFEQESLSYDELNRRANRLAHYLRGLGVQPDARVAICVERGFEMVVGLLGVLKAGGAYVPLDPSYPEERLRYMLQDSGALALLTQQHLKGLFADIQEDLAVMELDEPARWQTQPETDPDRASVGLGAEHLAYVIYTSGSTGTPKGVMGTHRATLNRIAWMYEAFPFGPNEVCCAKSSYSFVDSIWELFGPLLKGISIVVLPPSLNHNLAEFTRVLTSYRVTRLVLVPSLLRALVESDSAGVVSLPQLKYWSTSGEQLPSALAREFLTRVQSARLLNLYGSTEDAGDVTCYEVKSEPDTVSVPIGKPIANTRIYILDAQQQPVPVGVAGELYIGGAGVARGYLNRAELTAERFLKDPFLADREARMYRTGDLGRWLPDGNIEFLGRNDFQVKIRGFRIELGEIEARLAEHAQVREAVVVARQDTAGDKRLVAYYTCADPNDTALGAEVMRTHLAQKLPEYMVPAAYVRLESLPLTPNGKLDRRALPAPEADAFGVRAYEAPQTETEEVLAAIWAEVLKLDRVGRHDNFFELGGHSLLILTLVDTMGRRGMDLAPEALFRYPTLSSLAAHFAVPPSHSLTDDAICIRQEGAAHPLFVAPAIFGYLFLPSLTPHIASDIPLYALPWDSIEDAARTVEGMAMRMVRMIRGQQPAGPYCIAGYSFGGILAYEIATQLIGADQEVTFVGLIDTGYQSSTKSDNSDSIGGYSDDIHDLLRLVKESLDQCAPAAIAKIESVAATGDFIAFVRQCRQMSILPVHWHYLPPERIRRSLALLRRRITAVAQYRAQPLPVPVHLFVSTDRQENERTSRLLGWDDVLPKGQISLTPVPGTHTSMMETPNIEVLGNALSYAIRSSEESASKNFQKRFSPLQTLQSGQYGRLPLFCVPGAGGSLATFVDLVNHLDKSWPIYALQPRGLDNLFVPHSTVPTAADCYLNAIEQFTSAGPVHLLGHSFGGWQVFEMALKLLHSGRTIASLTIVDSDSPDREDAPMREYSNTEVLIRWLEIFELMLGRPLEITSSDLDSLTEAGQRELLHSVLVREGLFPRRSEPDSLRGPLRIFAMSLRTQYTPNSTYPGPVRLVLVDDPKLDVHANRLAHHGLVKEWTRWASGVTSTRVSGNHLTVLKPPNVHALATLLNSEIAANQVGSLRRTRNATI